MSNIPKELEDEAMRLPARLRASLAERLIASLDHEPADADAEALWVAEAQRRADELALGQTEAIPAAQALAKARLSLG